MPTHGNTENEGAIVLIWNADIWYQQICNIPCICHILCKYVIFCVNMRYSVQFLIWGQICNIRNYVILWTELNHCCVTDQGTFLLTEVITLIAFKSRKGCHTTSWKARCFKCQIYWKITQLYNIQTILAFLQKYHIFSSQNSILYCFIDPVLKHPHTSCFGRRQKVAINIDKP